MRRRSSTADRFRTSPNADAMATTTALAPNPDTPRRQGGETTPPAARSPAGASPGPRPSRSDSGACRSTNRLTLTLPIAPRTSDRSRPAPMMAAPSSIPPTPVETPTVSLPADASEFIIAIAAQERRVLELREELSRAEADLASLKRQWAAKEPLFQPGAAHQADAHGSSDRRASDDGAVDLRRSVEMDRKKLLLQGQNHGTPTQGNWRRVLRGGHARALSLLSPARPGSESHGLGPADSTTAQPANPVVLKRASWQAQSAQSSPSVPQIVEDFKLGLRAFVEDIRQVTVGDEPVSGQSGKATARGPGRPATGLAPGGSHSNTATPTPVSRFAAPVLETEACQEQAVFVDAAGVRVDGGRRVVQLGVASPDQVPAMERLHHQQRRTGGD